MFCPEYTAKLTHDGCVGKDKSARHVCSVKGGRRKLKAKSISLHRREEPRRNMGSSYPKSEEACYIPDIYCCDTQHLYSLPLPTSLTLPGIFWLMNLVLNMLSYQNTGARHWSRLEKKQVRFNSFSFWLLLQSWVGLTTLHYCPLRASDLLGISFSPLLPYISWLVILLLKQLADWVLWPLFHVGCLPYTVIPVWIAECMPFRSIYSVLHVAPEVWLEQSLSPQTWTLNVHFLLKRKAHFLQESKEGAVMATLRRWGRRMVNSRSVWDTQSPGGIDKGKRKRDLGVEEQLGGLLECGDLKLIYIMYRNKSTGNIKIKGLRLQNKNQGCLSG